VYSTLITQSVCVLRLIELYIHSFIHSFIHSIAMCRMRRFLVVLRSFFHASLIYRVFHDLRTLLQEVISQVFVIKKVHINMYTFSYHPSPPTILPSSLTSSYHLFLGLPLSLVDSKFIFNTLVGIQFSSFLCTTI
jgi:hypothetical protein